MRTKHIHKPVQVDFMDSQLGRIGHCKCGRLIMFKTTAEKVDDCQILAIYKEEKQKKQDEHIQQL